ncbi:FGGY-family carbohydrate kinase [Nakamurella lactea]|uniref:FGGY-family carbohydrate kinase n=1 Tax=Nakamurella lactea TaxID=459515 RepID=UPI0004084C75|nr:FGGY-family carbohydrate kinase [Nakamurella lactea]
MTASATTASATTPSGKTQCVVGVDIGTSSSKGVLVDTDGRVLATATREHDVQRPRAGHVEMDGSIWWDEFVAIVAELLAADEASRAEVAAVGVSGMGPCLLLADENSELLRPAILYGVDTRAGEQIDTLNAELGAEAIIERGGSALSSQAVGPKVRWVADNEPGVFATSRRLYMPSSYLVYRLSGRYVLDQQSASQCTPLYDAEEQAWYQPWWQRICGSIEQPDLHWSDQVVGSVGPEAAAETGLPQGIPVLCGTIDAWSEAISVDAHNVGDLMLMYGTTMFMVNTVADRVSWPTLWGTVGAFEGTRNLAGGMATSGAITGWLRELFGSPDYPTLLQEAASSTPGANGLLMLPYFAGERTPINDPDARGIVAGLTISHTRGDLYRAALEAIAFGVRHNIEVFEQAGGRIDRVVAVGGGTQGELWTQIVSDVTGRPQELRQTSIGASYGMAFLAARAIGGASMADWNPVLRIVEPNAALLDTYDERYRLYRELYASTADIAHSLAATQH